MLFQSSVELSLYAQGEAAEEGLHFSPSEELILLFVCFISDKKL